MDTNKVVGAYKIEDGPNRCTLFDSCKYSYDAYDKVQPRFLIALGYTDLPHRPTAGVNAMCLKDVHICSIEHEDGSGYSFNLKGYCLADTRIVLRKEANYTPYKFEAYYNARTRKGTFKLIQQ